MALVSDRGEKGRRGGPLSLEDCRCPVCLEIFMEPVTLPCTHTFCKDCFLESVDKATLCCPLCRKRVSTWARLNSRANTLVNQKLWTQIQTSFPLQCQRRLTGQDTVTEDNLGDSMCFPRVSQPGELRQEYEDQVTKLTEERRVLDEEERRASEEYIQRLLAEEEELVQEEKKRQEGDEKLARLISNQLNSAAVSQENLRPADATPAKKKEAAAGRIEKFLCPLPSKSSSSDSPSSLTANKENIFLSQVELQVSPSLLKLEYYGAQRDRSEPPSSPSNSVEDQPQPESLRSLLSEDKGPSSAKRKTEETTKDEDTMVTKRVCHSSLSSAEVEESSALLGIVECEKELLRRRQQEEEDRQLALLLQKQVDQEERQRATDRRKGSSDAYLLRQNRREAEASSSTTPSKPHRKTTKSSSVSSSRGSKQATLTEMFSNLNS